MNTEVLEFGEALVKTGDLDPVYIYLDAQEKQGWDKQQLKRWVLAYSMYYHAGVANYASCLVSHDFWSFCRLGIPHFPRSEERRHFRGKTATEAIELMSKYVPESIVDSWYKDTDFASVTTNVKKLKYYGPWIAFKLADIGERCLGYPINFINCELGVYSEPRQGAALVLTGDSKNKITNEQLQEVVAYITNNLNDKGLLAPPRADRSLNIQEAETILCKFKSFKHGHYYVGKDIEAVKKALLWKP